MPIPARLKNAPKMLLDHAREIVGNDWSRVTFEHGSMTIHNVTPQAKPPAPPPPPVPAGKRPVQKKTPVKRAAKKAAPPAPKQLNRDPVFEGESQEKVYEQKLVPPTPKKLPAELPKHLVPEPVRVRQTKPEPEPVKLSEPPKTTPSVRDRLSDAERAAARAFRQQDRGPVRRTDIAVPAEFDVRDAWEKLDVDRVASSMLNACRAGLPMELPLDMHADVLALEGIDFEIVKASVRNPHYVEIAGLETKEKGYPVLRFFRGDVTTVVGLREAALPKIIATYALATMNRHEVGTMKGTAGGGGARKQTGLPKTPAAVQKRLISLGATVKFDELRRGATAEVSYRGQELGKVSMKGDRNQCETDYQRMIRKMEAISRRD